MIINLFFSVKKLRDAMNFGAITTPGRDGLSYELFKHLDDIEILALFNSVWKEGCLRDGWH